MSEGTQKDSAKVLTNPGSLLADWDALYKDVHAHPELPMQESRTTGIAADCLRAVGYEVAAGVGTTGVEALVVAAQAGLSAQVR